MLLTPSTIKISHLGHVKRLQLKRENKELMQESSDQFIISTR